MKESIRPIKAPVGVDVHKRCCKVVEFDHGEIKVRKSIANTREEWLEMLTELPPDAEIGLEVSPAGAGSPIPVDRIVLPTAPRTRL